MADHELDPVAWLQIQPAAQTTDTARRQVLTGLARRAAAAQGPLRTALLQRLRQRLDRLPVQAAAAMLAAPARPLAALLAELGPAPALRSLSSQPRSWARLRLAQRLAQPAAQAPSQLGPLHAQALVPRALSTLRTLSPDYLQRLIAQLDGLALLAPHAPAEPAPARRGKEKR